MEKLFDSIRYADSCKDLIARAAATRYVIDYMRYALHWGSNRAALVAVEAGLGPERWRELVIESDRYGGLQ